MIEHQVALKYTHFVMNPNRTKIQLWAESHARGDYVFDNGAWRDHNPSENKGVEFELYEDAMMAVRKFGGSYHKRQVLSREDEQQNNI